ncbi:zinc finger protein [Gracilaria domingensis]|nr:zinc finger protein [Gracilaria domingensis]
METDLSVVVSDKLLDLDNELHAPESLLFARVDYPLTDLLFDPADNTDMFRSSLFDAASTELDAGSLAGSNTTTPPFRPGVYDSNIPGTSSQPLHQLPQNEGRNATRVSQAPCVDSEFVTYVGAGVRERSEHKEYQEYGRQLSSNRFAVPHNRSTVPLHLNEEFRAPYVSPTPFSLTAMGTLSAPVSREPGGNPLEQPIDPSTYARIAPKPSTRVETRQDVHFPMTPSLRYSSNRTGMEVDSPPRDHRGLPKFMCEVCHKSFRRGHNLKIHQRLHTGHAPYACPFPSCYKEYKWKSSIVSHINWHRNRKGHELQGFSTVSSLVKRGREVKIFRDEVAKETTEAIMEAEKARKRQLQMNRGRKLGEQDELPYAHLELPKLKCTNRDPTSRAPDSRIRTLPSVSSLRITNERQVLNVPCQPQQGNWNAESNWQSQQSRPLFEGQQPPENRQAQEGREAQGIRQAEEEWQPQTSTGPEETGQPQNRRPARTQPQEGMVDITPSGAPAGSNRLPGFSKVRETVSYLRSTPEKLGTGSRILKMSSRSHSKRGTAESQRIGVATAEWVKKEETIPSSSNRMTMANSGSPISPFGKKGRSARLTSAPRTAVAMASAAATPMAIDAPPIDAPPIDAPPIDAPPITSPPIVPSAPPPFPMTPSTQAAVPVAPAPPAPTSTWGLTLTDFSGAGGATGGMNYETRDLPSWRGASTPAPFEPPVSLPMLTSAVSPTPGLEELAESLASAAVTTRAAGGGGLFEGGGTLEPWRESDWQLNE